MSRPGPPAPAYQEYVALGDSWSADVVIADTDTGFAGAAMDCISPLPPVARVARSS